MSKTDFPTAVVTGGSKGIGADIAQMLRGGRPRKKVVEAQNPDSVQRAHICPLMLQAKPRGDAEGWEYIGLCYLTAREFAKQIVQQTGKRPPGAVRTGGCKSAVA